VKRLQPGEVEVYIAPGAELNAYTFGVSQPKVVVVYTGLLRIMDADEMLFILGHELGHVALGHTALNSLVGGMAGIPSPFSAALLLSLAFLWWNRACEFSADRAGLLACGKPQKAISALIKLAAGPQANTAAELAQAYRQVDAEDDTLMGSLNEAISTHPMLIRRINEIRRYAATEQYRRLLTQMERAA
jgi:Zn-dependent protease with chaperone function